MRARTGRGGYEETIASEMARLERELRMNPVGRAGAAITGAQTYGYGKNHRSSEAPSYIRGQTNDSYGPPDSPLSQVLGQQKSNITTRQMSNVGYHNSQIDDYDGPRYVPGIPADPYDRPPPPDIASSLSPPAYRHGGEILRGRDDFRRNETSAFYPDRLEPEREESYYSGPSVASVRHTKPLREQLQGRNEGNFYLKKEYEQAGPAPVAAISNRSVPAATSLNIGTDETTEKIRKRRMQQQYRLQLEEQFANKPVEVIQQRDFRDRRIAPTASLNMGSSEAEVKREDAMRKRREQEMYRAALDEQKAVNEASRMGPVETGAMRLRDRKGDSHRVMDEQYGGNLIRGQVAGEFKQDHYETFGNRGVGSLDSYNNVNSSAYPVDQQLRDIDPQSRRRVTYEDSVRGGGDDYRANKRQSEVRQIEQSLRAAERGRDSPRAEYESTAYEFDHYEGGQQRGRSQRDTQAREIFQDTDPSTGRARPRINIPTSDYVDKVGLMSPSKSPNAARQRMLLDVYGSKMHESSGGESWRPSKAGADDKEKKRSSIEQQKLILQQQIAENDKIRERERLKEKMEDEKLERKLQMDLQINAPERKGRGQVNDRDEILGGRNAEIKATLDIPDELEIVEEKIEKSVREALERKYGKHGAALRMQKEGKSLARHENSDGSQHGSFSVIASRKDDLEHPPINNYVDERSRAADYSYSGSTVLRDESSFHFANNKSPVKETTLFSLNDDYESDNIINHYSGNKSTMMNNKNDHENFRQRDAQVEQSLNSESLMMYTSDPSQIFGLKISHRSKDNYPTSEISPSPISKNKQNKVRPLSAIISRPNSTSNSGVNGKNIYSSRQDKSNSKIYDDDDDDDSDEIIIVPSKQKPPTDRKSPETGKFAIQSASVEDKDAVRVSSSDKRNSSLTPTRLSANSATRDGLIEKDPENKSILGGFSAPSFRGTVLSDDTPHVPPRRPSAQLKQSHIEVSSRPGSSVTADKSKSTEIDKRFSQKVQMQDEFTPKKTEKWDTEIQNQDVSKTYPTSTQQPPEELDENSSLRFNSADTDKSKTSSSAFNLVRNNSSRKGSEVSARSDSAGAATSVLAESPPLLKKPHITGSEKSLHDVEELSDHRVDRYLSNDDEARSRIPLSNKYRGTWNIADHQVNDTLVVLSRRASEVVAEVNKAINVNDDDDMQGYSDDEVEGLAESSSGLFMRTDSITGGSVKLSHDESFDSPKAPPVAPKQPLKFSDWDD